MKKTYIDNFYQILPGADKNYRIYSPAGVFMDLFVGTDKALLLDTGYGFGNLRETVRSLTDLPLIIVNTHAHVDHANGNWQFEEAVYLHPADFKLTEDHCGPARRGLAVSYAHNCPDPLTGEPRDLLGDDFDEETYLARGAGRLLPLEEGTVFDLGGIHLRVVHVPGHTPGSIGLIYEEEGIFYSGDSMNFNTWLFLPEATSLSVYRDSIRKMLSENFTRIMFSHLDVPHDKRVLEDFLELARTADYESGEEFSAPLTPGAVARFISRPGYTEADMGKGYATMVLGPDKL